LADQAAGSGRRPRRRWNPSGLPGRRGRG